MYFFDLDGTLLDSNGVWLDIDMEFLGRFGIGPVPEDYTDYVTHHGFDDSARYTRDYFRLPLTPEEIVAAWRELAREAYAGQLELKPGARGFLERARAAGIPLALLTSCIPSLCSAALERHRLRPLLDRVFTAGELGLEFKAGLLPEDKVKAVTELNQHAPLAMVGDGINDAPAMKAAAIGIAMGSGTDVALETADAALTHNHLRGLVQMIELARATHANIRQNITIALGLKGIFLVTTLLGMTGLWLAVLADTGATVLVTANALRLLRRR